MSRCPSRARDKPFAIAEQAAGIFPQVADLFPPPVRNTSGHCFRCWVLSDACLLVNNRVPNSTKVYNDPRSNSMGTGLYRPGRRPFKITVAGLSAEALKARLERLGSYVKDPLNSQVLRHLERDVVWVNESQHANLQAKYPRLVDSTSPGGGAGSDDELTMVWSFWEKGYGDVIANTLLPFGELLRMGTFPRHLALAGMRHATLLPPLYASTRSLCASERPNLPLLPRCQSACWHRIRICAPEFFESTIDTWRDTVALDAAAATLARSPSDYARRDPVAVVRAAYRAAHEPQLPARGGGFESGFATGSEMRVLIAARHGRRLLANPSRLARECNGTVLTSGTVLRCELLPPDTPQQDKIRRLRTVHAYVCVWGGDTVHSLHMRKGSAVVELRNQGFAAGAPWSWLELHKRWVTRFPGGGSDRGLARPLQFYPVYVPANATVITKAEADCFTRNLAKIQRVQRANLEAQGAYDAAIKNATSKAQAMSLVKPKIRRLPNESWLCYWNADLSVRLADILPSLQSYASGAAAERTRRAAERNASRAARLAFWRTARSRKRATAAQQPPYV